MHLQWSYCSPALSHRSGPDKIIIKLCLPDQDNSVVDNVMCSYFLVKSVRFRISEFSPLSSDPLILNHQAVSTTGCYPCGQTYPVLVNSLVQNQIWPPNLVTICAWLPKLVVTVSSEFHNLVNTGLVVGSLARWLPIMVAHTCKLDTIWVVHISLIGNGSIRL